MNRRKLSQSALTLSILLATASGVFAGTYGEPVEGEEMPTAAPAAEPLPAEEDEGWTFVITPQLWMPHIDSGGFAGGASLLPIETAQLAADGLDARFEAGGAEALDPLDLQWGVQLAARKGRWVIGASFQNTDFETRSDITYRSDTDTTLVLSNDQGAPRLDPGDSAAQEFVNTSRMDVDLAVSYLIPDLVPNVLDASVGGGFKMIYADSNRQYNNLDDVVAAVEAIPGPDGDTGLYAKCSGQSTCEQGGAVLTFADRAKSTTWMYGLTIPISLTTRLSDDGRWLLPVSVAPFIGAETRDDHNVVYKVIDDPTTTFVDGVDRQDGTFFAYGVTADATLRRALTDYLWAYAGFRVQYMNGESPNSDAFLAYGPLVGLSATFTTD